MCSLNNCIQIGVSFFCFFVKILKPFGCDLGVGRRMWQKHIEFSSYSLKQGQGFGLERRGVAILIFVVLMWNGNLGLIDFVNKGTSK